MADFSNIENQIDSSITTNGVGAITGAILNAILKGMLSAVDTEKEDTLTFDTEPTEDSTKPVTSGGVYDALASAAQAVATALSDYYTKTQADSLLATKADKNAVVHLTGDQTIAGVKTFSGNLVTTGSASFTTGASVRTGLDIQDTGIFMNGTKVEDLGTPTLDADAATKKYVDDGLATKQDTLVSGTNIKTVNNASILGNGNIQIEQSVETTYSALKTLRDNGELSAGTWYRITDYTCTTTQADTHAASNVFDILVRADDESHLNENAFVTHHDGDTYFANCKMEAWQLKYCIDNDTDRFTWADSSNGKGVVFYMKDEWGNECPYDFKNIQFKRSLTDGAYDQDNGTDTWCYTFNVYDAAGETPTNYDGSVEQFKFQANNDIYVHTFGNVIKPFGASMGSGAMGYPYNLNDIVFLNVASDFLNVASDSSCCLNIFGELCFSNTFGSCCSNNTFGNFCFSNTFGKECQHNTFGNFCSFNTFVNNCNSNTFGEECQHNTFVNNCNSNTFRNSCQHNTFGSSSYSNTFWNGCSNNTFGNSCHSNTFWNDCTYNTLSAYVIGVQVLNGTQANGTIPFAANVYYPQFAGKDANGILHIWIGGQGYTPIDDAEPSGGMLPNVYYNLGEITADTTFTMAAATDNTIANIWWWSFEIGATLYNVNFPAGVTAWAGGSAPTLAANKRYEITVKDGLGAYIES